jgi:O-acetyl-ADP-ribose deacetylase (regulator of RNase III)
MQLLGPGPRKARSVFRLRNVRVAVDSSTVEDVVNEGGFDALVSSDDASLAMQAGVAKSIREAAGDMVRDELARIQPAQLGDVLVTSAGQFPARFIFHAVTTDLEREVKSTESTIRSIGRLLFRRCEDLGVGKIAIPAIAVDEGELLANRSSRLILESLAQHANQPTRLKEVVFCLPDRRVRLEFLSELRAALGSDYDDRVPALEQRWTGTAFGTPLRGKDADPGDEDDEDEDDEDGDVEDGDVEDGDVEDGGLEDKSKAPAPGTVATSRPPDGGSIRNLLATLRSLVPGDPLRGVEAERYAPPSAKLDGVRDPVTSSLQATVAPGIASAIRQAESNTTRPLLKQRYVLLEEVGRGAMGVVHLAWDLVLRQTVAIKSLQPGVAVSPSLIDRLRSEAGLQMRLAHPGIVRLFHFEPVAGTTGPFIVMEYVPWVTAERWLADAGSEGLPPRAVLRIGERLCDAIETAHAAGVLHLDIKPSNIFVDPAGEQPKLADFGIATSLGPIRQDALVTRLVGTPAYMAPEQTTRGAKVGPWTDVYLLAGTLWELVTGRKASDDNDDYGEPDTVAALAVLRRGLAESIAERPQDARAFRSLLAAAFQGLQLA